MTSQLWRLRQFAAIDADGRVVQRDRAQASVKDPRVVGWRVRWDAPDGGAGSRNFAKSRFETPSSAFKTAQGLVARIEVARLEGWPCDDRREPRSPKARHRDREDTSRVAQHLGFADLADRYAANKGGAPGTRSQRESMLKFAKDRWGNRDPDAITTDDAEVLLEAKRAVVGPRARRAVESGDLHPDDPRAAMCSRRTERLFVNEMRSVFEYGMKRTPPACAGNPFSTVSVRGRELAIPDPTLEVTFTMVELLAIVDAISDPVLADGTLLRGFTLGRTGEVARLTVDDVDAAGRTITAVGTEGETSRRHSADGSGRAANSLKARGEDERRIIAYPDHPLVDQAVERLLEAASRRHAERDAHLARLIERYSSEGTKRHLLERREADLRHHRASSPRLVTMPGGGPFSVSAFSKRYWKPALAAVFPDDTREHRVRRMLRYYTLRSTGVQWMVEDCGVGETDVATLAGHSLETQRRHYRLSRGTHLGEEVRSKLSAGAAALGRP